MSLCLYSVFLFGDWGWTNGNIYTNRLCLFSALRGNSLVPFGEGWGWCTVNPSLYSNWSELDPRKRGSILEVGKADVGTAGYAGDKGDHETGYFNKNIFHYNILMLVGQLKVCLFNCITGQMVICS